MASDACSACLRSTGGTSGSVLTMRRSCVRSIARQLSAHRPDVKGRARHDRPFAIKRTARYGPRGMAAFTRWIHLLGLATYFGTTLGLAPQLPPAAAQTGMIRRMRTGAWLGLALAAWTAWVGVGLTP